LPSSFPAFEFAESTFFVGFQIESLYRCALESRSAFGSEAELEAVVKRPKIEPLDGTVVASEVDVTGRVFEVGGRELEAIGEKSDEFNDDEEVELSSG
jgi:hypothetical protein